MKLTIDRKELLRVLSHVHSVVEKRTTIPILSNMLLRADGTRLTATATDLDLEASDSAPAEITLDGATTAPASTLFDIARKLPDGAQVTLHHDFESGQMRIESGRARFALPTLPAEDFQTMAALDEKSVRFTLASADLRRLIDKTRFAISGEETRYYLNGIYLHHHAGEDAATLRAVATDGHRLALAEIPAPPDTAALDGAIVPRKAVVELIRLLDDAAQEVLVSVSDSTIMFRVGAAVLISKLIEGSFPDYTRVIPTDNQVFLRLDNREFSAAVDRVSVVSTERARAVKMIAQDGKLSISVKHSESGQGGDEDIAAEYDASEMEIGFNARYLLDIAGNIEGETVIFALKDGGSPALITDSDDSAARYVLMPLRV